MWLLFPVCNLGLHSLQSFFNASEQFHWIHVPEVLVVFRDDIGDNSVYLLVKAHGDEPVDCCPLLFVYKG